MLSEQNAGAEFDQLINGMITESLSDALDDPLSRMSLEEATTNWIAFAQKCTIVSGTKVTRFDPYPYQIDAFKQICLHRGVIFGKVRQMGLTELISNIFLWKAWVSRAYSAAVFSQTGDDTAMISERVKLMASSHPDVRLKKENVKEISLENGGKILFRTSTGEGARGLPSLDDLLCDEWAFVKEDKKIWGAATPAQNMSGRKARTIVVSTPPEPGVECEYKKMLFGNNGDRDVYEITKDMREGRIAPMQHWTDEDGWCKFFAHFMAHPVYSQRENHLEQVRADNKVPDSVIEREHNLNFEAKIDDSLVDLNWFPRFHPNDLPTNPWLILQSWDTAQTDNPRSADWAGITFLCYGSDIFIADVILDKFVTPDGQRQIEQFARRWRPHQILIENKSSGLDIIPRLRLDPNFPFPIVSIDPPKTSAKDGDPKVLRFEQELAAIKYDHRVLLPHKGSGAEWLAKVESDLERFPKTKRRDFADSLSQGLKHIRLYRRTALSETPIGAYDAFLNGDRFQDKRLHGIL